MEQQAVEEAAEADLLRQDKDLESLLGVSQEVRTIMGILVLTFLLLKFKRKQFKPQTLEQDQS